MCRTEQPRCEFSKCVSNPDGLQYRCRDCQKEARASYPPEKLKASQQRYLNTPKGRAKRNQITLRQNLERRFGISIEEYKSCMAAESSCAICGHEFEQDKKVLDHDHDTKKVRGVLCNKCNMALGLFKDRPSLLRAAADYIERHV